MIDGINFHPGEEILDRFCRGQLSIGLSVAVSAHVEFCPRCSQLVAELEQGHSQEWASLDEYPDKFAGNDDAIISNIVDQPQQFVPGHRPVTSSAVQLPDGSVTLPRALSGTVAAGLVWKKLAGGINQARLDIDNATQCEFLYMKPGSRAPVHTHQGTEVTLVLDGKFSDELGDYADGDFLIRKSDVIHQPRSDKGCLVFAVLDSPLTFTSGLLRLFNPINRLRFSRSMSRSGG
ncbi:MAG: ChrR family anti-sigma-E factor [Gammaproteobacteria bacterium]